MNKYRSYLIKDVDETLISKEIKVSGWVENIRDHGGVLFLDLRDETGTLQTVSNDDEMFKGVAKESVVCLEGTIRKRDDDTFNPRLKTGTIEMLVSNFTMINESLHELPFEALNTKS